MDKSPQKTKAIRPQTATAKKKNLNDTAKNLQAVLKQKVAEKQKEADGKNKTIQAKPTPA